MKAKYEEHTEETERERERGQSERKSSVCRTAETWTTQHQGHSEAENIEEQCVFWDILLRISLTCFKMLFL